MNRATTELTNKKDQLGQVREMLAAERAGKERLNAKLTSQLETARKKIGE